MLEEVIKILEERSKLKSDQPLYGYFLTPNYDKFKKLFLVHSDEEAVLKINNYFSDMNICLTEINELKINHDRWFFDKDVPFVINEELVDEIINRLIYVDRVEDVRIHKLEIVD